MALSQILGSFYKLPKSDPYAVYQLPYAAYLIQCCFITANIVWAGQCHNSLFLRKLTAQETINTAIKNQSKRKSVFFPLFYNYFCQISACSLSFYSAPSTEGVECTRGNSVCVSVCLFVRNHFFLFRIFNDLMVQTMQTIYFLKAHHAGNQYRPVLAQYH